MAHEGKDLKIIGSQYKKLRFFQCLIDSRLLRPFLRQWEELIFIKQRKVYQNHTHRFLHLF